MIKKSASKFFKTDFKKYLFETIVIFIGITISFMANEWKVNAEKRAYEKDLMESIVHEIKRSDEFLRTFDTTYLDITNQISRFVEGDTIADDQILQMLYTISEYTHQGGMTDITAYLLGFSSNQQLDLIRKDKDILKYISYIKSLIVENESLNQDIYENCQQNIWPLLANPKITTDLIDAQRFLMNEIDTIQFVGDYEIIRKDKQLSYQLNWTRMKILRLIDVNKAIHFQNGRLIEVLEEINN